MDSFNINTVLLYGSIPVISPLAGWLINLWALKMTFFPIEFIGIQPYFVYQGIIPSKVKKMSSLSVDLWAYKLINVKKLFSKIDPNEIAKELRPIFQKNELKLTLVGAALVIVGEFVPFYFVFGG